MDTLLAIKSCHRYADRRYACADTWLSDWDGDFRFLLGRPDRYCAEPDSSLLVDTGISDAFEDIAPKVRMACRHALENNYRYLVVADDDTYVCVPRLLRSGYRRRDYSGWVRAGAGWLNDGVPYMQGSCYTLSEHAMELVAAAADVMRPGVIDDGAVGKALIDKVPFTHDWRFEPGPECLTRYPCKDNTVISTHKCLPGAMRRVRELCGGLS